MQMVECVVPPLEPEEEVVSPMRAKEPDTSEELSATQMIENVVGDLEPEGLELVVAPLKAGEEAGTNEVVPEELPTNRGLEAEVHEVVELNERVRRLAKHIPSSLIQQQSIILESVIYCSPMLQSLHLRTTILSTY